MAQAYDAVAVERKWQNRWREERTYEVENDDPRPAFYSLCMYPYPSGPAHQGHVRNYTLGDLIVRRRTMQGYAVLSPIGFDSFGLPAENAAIKTGTHPRIFTDERIAELNPGSSPTSGSPSSRTRSVASGPSTTGAGSFTATTPNTSGGTR